METQPCSCVGGTSQRISLRVHRGNAWLMEDKEYKAATENHIKFEIELYALISKEKLKYDHTLIQPVGIIKALIPVKRSNIANKNSTNGPF